MADDMFRSRLRRSGWVPVVIGGTGAIVTAVLQAIASGGPENMVILALVYLPFGLALGAAVLLIGLGVDAIARTSAWRTMAISVPLSIAVSTVSALLLTRGWLLIPFALVSTIAASAHVVTARTLARRQGSSPIPRPSAPPGSSSPSGRNPRLAILAGGAVLIAMLALGAVGMLREGLHMGCGYGTMGEEVGSWMCADGIGYIFPGVTLIGLSALPLLGGVGIVFAETRSTAAMLRWCAVAPPLLVAGWLASTTLGRTDPLPVGETWGGVWVATVGIAGGLCVLGAGIVAASAASRSRLIARMLVLGGSGLLLAAFIVQPGLGAAIASTAALLGAASIHAGHLAPAPAGDA